MNLSHWRCGRFVLDLNEPKIMGVLNCTPDSFSDGGLYVDIEQALPRVEQMISEGVDIIDIGAESTRPGSNAISATEEIQRLAPLVKILVADGRKPISIDTKKTIVMREMLALGVDMINDVHGFEDPGAIELLSKYHNVALCIMHMRGMPENMQHNTDYQDVVAEVDYYLQQRVAACLAAGIDSERIILDPGFGFGKTPQQNMRLVRECEKLKHKKYPVLLGVSRKSTIGYYLKNNPVNDRLIGSVTLAVLSTWFGANIVRVHDIKETRDALRIASVLKREEEGRDRSRLSAG